MTTHIAISWPEIRKYNFTNPPRIVLGRSLDIDSKYKKDSISIKKNGSMERYLIEKYLSNDNDYNMAINNYPYYLEEGINHYVIWFKKEKFDIYNNPGSIEKIIKEFIFENELGNSCNFIYYQNIEELRSIPSIPHVHVYINNN